MEINPFLLKNKLIVVTGASSGIGQQCAITASMMEADVILLGRNKPKLDETFGRMISPERHKILSVDLLDYDNVAKLVSQVVEEKGKIDGLINCAGISTTLPIGSMSIERMEYFFQTNVIGSINLTRHVLKSKHFSSSGGSIVFVSSVMSMVGEMGKTLYSMTKGALISATKSLAVEVASRRIRVNSISPGVVLSPMSGTSIYSRNEESWNRIIQMHPLGIGQPEDVANASVFLLSDASRWITGTNLIVDGGYTAK